MKRLLFAMTALVLFAGAAPPTGSLDIYFIDVMGGAATLVVTPDRESILIDSGWPGLEDRDPKRIVHVLKDVAGLESLDHLVTTHWHTDHYGGVEGLNKRIKIGRFWDRGLPGDDGPEADFPDGPKPTDKLGIAYRKASLGKRTALKAGDELPLKGHVKVVVLASGTKLIEGDKFPANPLSASAPADRPEDPSDNARSLVLRFKHGVFDFLDCGDLTWNVEKALVCPVDRIGPIDLYQVTHHGMDISNHPTLIQTISPKVAIMNNGPRKGGSAQTVKRLREIPSIEAAYQLHKNVATSASENADPAWIANTDPKGGQFIHVSVAPDGKTYTVRIGKDGAVKTFTSK